MHHQDVQCVLAFRFLHPPQQFPFLLLLGLLAHYHRHLNSKKKKKEERRKKKKRCPRKK